MGLDDVDLPDDGDGGGGGEDKASSAIACSICLEIVTDNGDRSFAKLQCGHQFHLDCIGSAFNIKGQMQCPNCRKIEKGQWLFASGSRPSPEVNIEDWAVDEDIYDLNYTDMSFGIQWCPFSGLTRLPSSFDDGDFSSSAYHELLRQQTIFAEQTALSSAAQPCPYIAYVGIHPSSSNSSDGNNFNSQWNSSSVPNEMPPSYALQGMGAHYHGWEHQSSFPTASSRVGNADQSSIPSANQRAVRTNSDIPRPVSLVHPFLVSHSSAARAGSSVASSVIPPYPGSVARARDRVQALQAYYQQPSNSVAAHTPVISGTRRSSSHRGLAQVGPVASSSEQAGGFYIHPSGSSGRTFQEAENSASGRFHAWEQEHMHVFPPTSVDRDSIWGPFHQAAGSSFRQRRGSERMPSHNWS